jgi:FixJ family two-component response regulator
MKSHAASSEDLQNGASTPAVYVIDDDPSFRSAVTRLLTVAGYRVVPYPSAEKAIEALPVAERGCILLDVQMPGLSGPQLQERLAAAGCPLPIVFMTGHGDIPTSVRAIKAGAEDFLSKPVSKDMLLDAIERALRRYDGEHERGAKQQQMVALASKLTPREHEVFHLVVRGKMNKQIAYQLGTSERTIKAHRHNIMTKLGVGSVAELVSFAERLPPAPSGESRLVANQAAESA